MTAFIFLLLLFFYIRKGKKKILGICLGFQQILFNEKGKIAEQKNVYHGFQSKVKVLNNSKLFKKINCFQLEDIIL